MALLATFLMMTCTHCQLSAQGLADVQSLLGEEAHGVGVPILLGSPTSNILACLEKSPPLRDLLKLKEESVSKVRAMKTGRSFAKTAADEIAKMSIIDRLELGDKEKRDALVALVGKSEQEALTVLYFHEEGALALRSDFWIPKLKLSDVQVGQIIESVKSAYGREALAINRSLFTSKSDSDEMIKDQLKKLNQLSKAVDAKLIRVLDEEQCRELCAVLRKYDMVLKKITSDDGDRDKAALLDRVRAHGDGRTVWDNGVLIKKAAKSKKKIHLQLVDLGGSGEGMRWSLTLRNESDEAIVWDSRSIANLEFEIRDEKEQFVSRKPVVKGSRSISTTQYFGRLQVVEPKTSATMELLPMKGMRDMNVRVGSGRDKQGNRIGVRFYHAINATLSGRTHSTKPCRIRITINPERLNESELQKLQATTKSKLDALPESITSNSIEIPATRMSEPASGDRK